MDLSLSSFPLAIQNAFLSLIKGIQDPWTLYQFGIIVICFLVALLLARRYEPALEERARAIKGNPSLLRIIIAVMRRSEQVIFIALLFLARTILQTATWPSRSHIIAIVIALALAWFLSAVASRIIRNRTFARLAALAIFTYFMLDILNIRQDVTTTLDNAAINLGDFRFSALFVIRSIGLMVLFVGIAALAGRLFENRIAQVEDLSPSFKVLAGKMVKISLVVIAGAMALSASGIDLTALTIFSGAIGVGLGFGLQKVVSNFISGVIILADKSIKPGDTIELGDTFGWIRELRSRFVSVITRDGREYLIPNEDFITQQVINWSYSDQFVRLDVDFGVSYDSNPHEVTKLAIEAAKTVERVLPSKNPVCWMTGFGASSLDFKLRFWIRDPQGGLTNVRGQVLLALWDAFDQNGVNIPFPHREIIMRTPVEIKQAETKTEKKVSD